MYCTPTLHLDPEVLSHDTVFEHVRITVQCNHAI